MGNEQIGWGIRETKNKEVSADGFSVWWWLVSDIIIKLLKKVYERTNWSVWKSCDDILPVVVDDLKVEIVDVSVEIQDGDVWTISSIGLWISRSKGTFFEILHVLETWKYEQRYWANLVVLE